MKRWINVVARVENRPRWNGTFYSLIQHIYLSMRTVHSYIYTHKHIDDRLYFSGFYVTCMYFDWAYYLVKSKYNCYILWVGTNVTALLNWMFARFKWKKWLIIFYIKFMICETVEIFNDFNKRDTKPPRKGVYSYSQSAHLILSLHSDYSPPVEYWFIGVNVWKFLWCLSNNFIK